jgi:hypothetical protein
MRIVANTVCLLLPLEPDRAACLREAEAASVRRRQAVPLALARLMRSRLQQTPPGRL